MTFTDPLPETLDAFPGVMDAAGAGPVIPTLPARPTLAQLAEAAGDISGWLDETQLHALGAEVVADYKRDLADRREWQEIVEEAQKAASQEERAVERNSPWRFAANVKFPLLTTAALQFNARAYPAIVKGDEAVSVKVVGKDRGKPALGPDGQPLVQGPDGQPLPLALAQQAPPEVQAMLQPLWAVPPGAKQARAARVAEYLNTVLFYRMEDWEADTDSLLIQLPIVGCAFRKVWFDPATQMHRAVLVPALRIVVPEGARSCDTTPRLTEEIPDVYPHEIRARIRSGFYREIVLPDDEEKAGARLLLEQHRLMDLDEDGIEEPYIVTVDHETETVLRIEPNFAPDDVRSDGDAVLGIRRNRFYVKYDFFPHPQGRFYGIGLGHLLKQVGAVVDTAINQLLDAGTAQTAGGGFIASGVRLQGRGNAIRFEPGEYKTVDGVSGIDLRNAIVERTLPNVSPVTFQVLDLIMGAARDISGVKDVITGDASNTGQVGTTLALIEQGLQVYNAVFKRIYRALKDEFTLIYRNLGRYGGDAAARDYAEVMDDPAADFARDFAAGDFDIRPVSDPTSPTRIQKATKAQGLIAIVGTPGVNPAAIVKRYLESLEIENPDELLAPPAEPDPRVAADAQAKQATATRNMAEAEKALAQKEQIEATTATMAAREAWQAFVAGHGLADAAG